MNRSACRVTLLLAEAKVILGIAQNPNLTRRQKAQLKDELRRKLRACEAVLRNVKP